METKKTEITPINILAADQGADDVITQDFDPIQRLCQVTYAGRDLSQKVLKDRHLHLATFFEWFATKGSRMSADVFVHWRQYLASRDDLRSNGRKNAYLTSVRYLMYYLIRVGLLDRDITIGVKQFKVERHRRKSALKQRDVGRIFGYIRAIKDPYERAATDVLFCLLVYDAMRESEIRGMKWEQVDIKSGTVMLIATKKKANEEVRLHGNTVDALKKLRRFPGPNWKDAPVLTTTEGKDLKYWRCTARMMNRVLKPLKIEATLHDFRALAITKMSKESLMSARNLARHSDISVTSGYIVGRDEILERYLRRDKRRVAAKKRRKAVKKRSAKRKTTRKSAKHPKRKGKR